MVELKKERFWEIDVVRAIAIVIMIVFHIFFDLNLFCNFTFNIQSGFWFWLVRVNASVFLLLVGISLTLSFSRVQDWSLRELTKKYLKRGIRIFGWGMLITIITWMFFSAGTIFFGVLHLIGLSIILAIPFLKRKNASLLLGIILVVIGLFLGTLSFEFNYLLWLGFTPENLYTFDYFPLLPWFGVVLIGMFLGKTLYPNGERKMKVFENKSFPLQKKICFIGNHSLFIYLVHQPVLIAIISMLC
jgi:uncharacterized membrane protein